MINWNMIILLVFITFNIAQICRVIERIANAKSIMTTMPRDLMKAVVKASIKQNEDE